MTGVSAGVIALCALACGLSESNHQAVPARIRSSASMMWEAH